MHTPDLRWLAAASGAARTWPQRPAAGLQGVLRAVLQALGATPWPAAAALLVGLGLLLAFQQVVSGAVRQGELRRAAAVTATDHGTRSSAVPLPKLVKPLEK